MEIKPEPKDAWAIPAPNFKSLLPEQMANILFVKVANLSMPTSIDDPAAGNSVRPCILVTEADRSLRIFDFYTFDLLKVYLHIHSSPILMLEVLDESNIMTGGMDGRLVISTPSTGEVTVELKDHFKYLVKIAISKDHKYVATAGYDKKVHVYSLEKPESGPIVLSKIGTLTFPTNPEAAIFVYADGEDGATTTKLVVSRRDSTFLYYYKLQPNLVEFARHNLNPESNSWVSFCAMDLVLDPTEHKYLGAVTSTVPHMRFMLLESGNDTILKNAFTRAPQDAYSTSRVTWRPQGSVRILIMKF